MTPQTPHSAPASPPAAGADPGPFPAVDPDLRPVRPHGVSLLGEYEGGGYDEPRYLVSRSDGQMVLVSRMLNAVLAGVTDDRTLAEVAESASHTYGAVLSPEAVRAWSSLKTSLSSKRAMTITSFEEAGRGRPPLIG